MKRPPTANERQRGVALITAMLIVALVTMLTGAAIWDFHLDQRRTEAVLFSDLGTNFALGAEAWAGRILIEDAEDGNVDHPDEIWATNLPPLPIDGGSVDGALIDLQGRFNLNNLVDGEGNTDTIVVQQLERLLTALELDRRWAGLIADWIDLDINPNFPDGAEDSSYMSQVPPYRPPNGSAPTGIARRGWRATPHTTYAAGCASIRLTPAGTMTEHGRPMRFWQAGPTVMPSPMSHSAPTWPTPTWAGRKTAQPT